MMVDFMDQALNLGREALEANEVPVGCVFTLNGEIIAESRNTVNETRNPTRHAEINCIDKVINYCKQKNLQNSLVFEQIVVYVTVEPCIMCAAALKKLKVKEVIYGCANDRFGGKTVLNVGEIYENGFKLTEHSKGDQAMLLLKQFYKGTNPHAPESKVRKKK
ncbi:tRNA-specific adenosine deaminase 2 [Colias croceus]|uniref:tRNA-specific adenosine deaminase 2 n=1 Tax=Colias crocea TaxID=72248 RepID=UPI001E280875|nr:tRNA-specific adenosine deaminase 2 [Colias croceus]